jgi:hypothetical protein
MRKEPSIQAIREQILSCVGNRREFRRKSFTAKLKLREGVSQFEPQDCERFREELYKLVTDTDNRWPSNEMWHSPQGYLCNLDGYPTLRKYLSAVRFHATTQPGGDWIEFDFPGGAFVRGERLGV